MHNLEDNSRQDMMQRLMGACTASLHRLILLDEQLSPTSRSILQQLEPTESSTLFVLIFMLTLRGASPCTMARYCDAPKGSAVSVLPLQGCELLMLEILREAMGTRFGNEDATQTITELCIMSNLALCIIEDESGVTRQQLCDLLQELRSE